MLWSQRPRDWTSRLSTRPIHTRAAAPQHNTNTITQGSSINGSADGLSRVVYAAGSCDVRSRVRPLLLPPPAPPAPPPPLSSLRVRPTRLNCCRHLPCTYTQTHAPKHPPTHTHKHRPPLRSPSPRSSASAAAAASLMRTSAPRSTPPSCGGAWGRRSCCGRAASSSTARPSASVRACCLCCYVAFEGPMLWRSLCSSELWSS